VWPHPKAQNRRGEPPRAEKATLVPYVYRSSFFSVQGLNNGGTVFGKCDENQFVITNVVMGGEFFNHQGDRVGGLQSNKA